MSVWVSEGGVAYRLSTDEVITGLLYSQLETVRIGGKRPSTTGVVLIFDAM